MLLVKLVKFKAAIFLLLFSFSAFSQTSNYKFLEEGLYRFVSGDKEFCHDFRITAQNLVSKNIFLGGGYFFKPVIASYKEQSTYPGEENCIQRTEYYKRELEDGKTLELKRLNDTLCDKNSKEAVNSIALISAGEVKIIHTTGPGAIFKCVFKKQ